MQTMPTHPLEAVISWFQLQWKINLKSKKLLLLLILSVVNPGKICIEWDKIENKIQAKISHKQLLQMLGVENLGYYTASKGIKQKVVSFIV